MHFVSETLTVELGSAYVIPVAQKAQIERVFDQSQPMPKFFFKKLETYQKNN
jgi:hypothetical protein